MKPVDGGSVHGRFLIAITRRSHVILLVPAVALLVVFSVIPMVLVLVLTFLKYEPLSGAVSFAGLDNFTRLMASGELARSTINTLVYTGLTVPVTLVVGLVVALLIRRSGRMSAVWTSLYFLPIASTLAAMAIVWQWIFYPQNGIVDQTVGRILGVTDWLNSPTMAMPAIAVIGNWQAIGTAVILFLAGLSSLRPEAYEAAHLDGAGAWSTFIHVTLPAVGPAAVFALVLTTRNSLAVFDQVAVVTKGGPFNSTDTLAFTLYRRAIEYVDIGGGAVVTVALTALLVVVAALQLVTVGRRLNAGGAR